MISLDGSAVIAERLRRQRFLDKVDAEDEYVRLFRLMQPVSPPAFSRPGNPPILEGRVAFDDSVLTDRLRKDRIIIKGRFLSGNVGYVFADQLANYAAAFRRPITTLNPIQERVLDIVQRMGPVNIHQIREETGFLSKQIVPALHRLQRAFLVYEDQVNSDWERPWYDFESEWPDVDIEAIDTTTAVGTIIKEFLKVHVFATVRHISDWTGLPLRKVENIIDGLENDEPIRRVTVAPDCEGLLYGEVSDSGARLPEHHAILLTHADMLVRSHRTELKRLFAGKEVLRYLLVNGELLGAVIGHWRIGPHDVDDIDLKISRDQAIDMKETVLDAVAKVYQPPRSTIKKYMGNPI